VGAWPIRRSRHGRRDVLDGVGGGWMLGYRRGKVTRPEDAGDNSTSQEKVETQSFNMALGVLLDGKTEVFRDNVSANQPSPSSGA